MAHLKTLTALTAIVRRLIDEATASRWTAANVTAAINESKDRVWNAVRGERDDYFYATIESDDAPSTILGETYTPTSSLAVTVGGTTLTLPHNCVEVRVIETITSGKEFVTWRALDVTHPDFRAALAVTGNVGPSELLFDVQNERTVRYAPKSDTALDIRLHYIFQPADLSAGADELQMPYPLEWAVVYFACASLMLQDDSPTAAAFENRARQYINEVLGVAQRQTQDTVVASGMFEDL